MARVNFWTEDRDGERWLVNGPELIIAANRPKKGKRKKMARRKAKGAGWGKGHMAWVRSFQKNKRGGKRKSHGGRRRRAKTNMYAAGPIANPRRRRSVTRYVTKTRYRSNPGGGGGMLGKLGIPAIEPIAGAFAGLAVPPMVNYFVGGFMPASITGHPIGKYAWKAATVVVPSYLVKRFVNRNVGNIMMIVGIGKLLIDAVKEFVPSIPWLEGMGYQPMLGYYPGARRGLPAMRQVPMMQTPMIAGVPDRLNPMSRH